MRVLVPILACALWATTSVAAADAESYRLDPVHTRVVLAIDHAGFSKAIGTVSGATGTLWTTGEDWTDARVDVSVPLDRLDFGDADWNRAVAARGLLDTARHPVARFVSTRIEAIDAGRAIVHGTLTLRGVTREVALDAVRNGARRHPLPPFRRTVGFSATTTLTRADFGVDAWRSMIGETVELRLEVEATRGRAEETDDIPTAPATTDPLDDTPSDVDPETRIDAEPPSDPAPEQEATPSTTPPPGTPTS
ncbi:YceI family protein [Luteimonas cellulosilyticus]|uniref:YceI family protein n=1 Tax=Luteimonas cellulosilyticus TaxID=2683586 RepID=UPI003CCD83CA